MSAPASPVTISQRHIGPGYPTFVIAELSANHGGSLSRAEELVHAAAEAGADAVKLQTYTPETMTLDSDQPWFSVGPGTLWSGRRLHDLYAEAQTPWEWHAPLFELARSLGLEPLSAPFDPDSVQKLVELGVRALKVASFELVDTGLLEAVAATGLPVLLSTGMATLPEIDRAVATLRGSGCSRLILLRCNSAYPAAPQEMDLRTIPHMSATWDVPAGLSDHTLSPTATTAAVALGACVVEKHLTGSRTDPTADSAFSLEPTEFAALVRAIRETEAALGSVRYGPSASEAKSLQFRRSLFFLRDLAAGDRVDATAVGSRRPCVGLAPWHQPEVVGRCVRQAVRRGDPVVWNVLEAG
ncbi:MAG: pseudaminic acid synthase [Acidimicrobiales bacterium]